MKFEYTFNKKHSLLMWRQPVTVDTKFLLEVAGVLRQLEVDRPPFDRFVDLTEVKGINVVFDDMWRIAGMRANYRGPRVKAAFYSNHPLGVGISRMYQVLMDDRPVEVEVFQELGLCANWLGVPVDLLHLA